MVVVTRSSSLYLLAKGSVTTGQTVRGQKRRCSHTGCTEGPRASSGAEVSSPPVVVACSSLWCLIALLRAPESTEN